ncbi:conjugal transfer protein [Enterococcus sp. DIV1420a]|uniref:conjugal transfer protein n=1 Tax=Enterococcus sp. DIV1420a TaxID=2774672 RepID=UPI003F20CD2B
MKLFKRKKQQLKSAKLKKNRQSRVPRVILYGGWLLLVFSVCFGVYNNLTVVSTHTVHEKEVIKEQLIDTTGLQSYVKGFATTYFTVSPTSNEQQKQKEALSYYLSDTVSPSIYKEVKEKVTAEDVEILQIIENKNEKNRYSVLFKLLLKTTNDAFMRAYSVDVYAHNNQFLIVKLPILASMPNKALLEIAKPAMSSSIDATTRETVEGFLTTFFTVYPKADEKELIYYGKQIQPIHENLTFLEITNPQMTETKEQVEVTCTVVYKDNETKLLLEMPYQLSLEKLADKKFAIKELN